jgi:branched-chain amino acid transport system substrate-binding protein
MAKLHKLPVSRRKFITGSGVLAAGTMAAGTIGFPLVGGAQAAPVKVGLIHPLTGFVGFNGSQLRLGSLMAIDDINKAGGIKSMGGAKLEPLLGDSQSKVEVGVAEVEKMNEQGAAAFIGCYQSPVVIAASQAAAKYGTPFLVDVGASDLIVSRGLKNVFRIKPGFGACVDQGIDLLGGLNKAANNIAKSAVIVHESSEFGTGTAKLLAAKLPGINIAVKDVIAHDNPTRNFDNIALRIRSMQPDLVMMSNYQDEYTLLARTLYQQKINVAGFFSLLGGGFNYKFVQAQPDVSQYMMDVNHWYNPKSEKAQAMKKRVTATGALFTFEVYLSYTVVCLLADALEHAGSADKEKLTAALNASTFNAELMPYGPTKFVNGQNTGGRPGVMQAIKGDIVLVAPEDVAEAKAVFPKPKL